LHKKDKILNVFNSNLEIAIKGFSELNNHELKNNISKACEYIIAAFKSKKKLLICGNGGSAADAQHICAEFVSKFLKVRVPLPAISLTTNTSNLTSIGNDFSYNAIFSKQIEAIGNKGDILLAISTSGKSKNVINAINVANRKKMKVIILTSYKAPKFGRNNLVIRSPGERVDRIQEHHIFISHNICEIVESFFYKNK
jgi:D-sedoheptulose 7-phosphate isomerase